MEIETYPRLTNATSDTELIRYWIAQKSKTTQQTYLMVVRQFQEFMGKELSEVMVDDIILWLESFELRKFSDNTMQNKLAAIKSLFSFGLKTGYLKTNPARMLKSPKPKDALNERILSESEVRRLIDAADNQRDRLLIVLIYVLGLRVSELVGLSWSDFKETPEGVLVTVFGKNSQTRILVLEPSLWEELQTLPRSFKTEAVFVSRCKNRLDRHAVHRVVKKVAKIAGINPQISAHWLRHAHACHSLKNGAGIDLLMKSLGHTSLSITSRYLHCQVGECTSKFIKF
jgi:integrase/recombinase XerD